MKKHLVLSGSGTLFPYFIGAIRRLEKENIEFKSISGVSGGSIIGAFLACGMTSYDIEKLLKENKLSSFVDVSWNPLHQFGLIKGERLYKFFKKYLPVKFNDPKIKIPLTIITTNLSHEYNTQREQYFSTQYTPDIELPLVVRASLSIPFLFKYVVIDNEIHIDGGISNNFPLNTIPVEESKDIIGIKFDTSFAPKRKLTTLNLFNLMDYILSIIDTFINTIEREHIKDSVYSKVISIKTTFSGTNFNFTNEEFDLMIKTGYNFVDEWLKNNSL